MIAVDDNRRRVHVPASEVLDHTLNIAKIARRVCEQQGRSTVRLDRAIELLQLELEHDDITNGRR